MTPAGARQIATTICTVLLGLLSAFVRVQAEQLPIKTYTTLDGLNNDRIVRIVADSRGFLWFCTVDGLSRFDGYHFTSYGVDQGLPTSLVHDIQERRDGSYWVATWKGVCQFNPAARASGESSPLFTVFPVGDEATTQRVQRLYEDREGRLWAGTQGGLFCLIEGAFRRVGLGLATGQDRLTQVHTIVEDREGSLWIGTTSGLVRRLIDGRMIHYEIPVSTLLYDRDERLWVGAFAEIIVFKPKPVSEPAGDGRFPWLTLTEGRLAGKLDERGASLPAASGEALRFSHADGLPRKRITAFCQSADGRTWLGTEEGGLVVFDARSFRTYTTTQGLSDNVIVSVLEDRHDNLWVGTFSRGVMKIARHGLVSFSRDDGLAHTRILAISEDLEDRLYVISYGLAINRFDGTKFKAIRPQLTGGGVNPGWDYYHRPLHDRTGQWWVPTKSGIYRFPKVRDLEQLATTRPQAIYTIRNGLANADTWMLFEDSRGDIWISTPSPVPHQLTRWERATETFHQYGVEDGVPAYNQPYVFCEDGAGGLWIGFSNGNLIRYRAGRFMPVVLADQSPGTQVRALYRDYEGRVWIGTAGAGLIRVDDPEAEQPRAVTYTTANGLAGNTIRCITEDRWRRIYVGAGNGVDRIDLQANQIKHYTLADGLANSYVNVAFCDHQGRLWFGMLNGLSRLVPELDHSSSSPPILISALRIAGDTQAISELGATEIVVPELQPSQNQIQIDFVGLGLAAGESLRYQYKLEGADHDWNPPTDRRNVNYGNLGAGSYRFLVRAISADGMHSESPATVAFKILPPIWQRWWFITLAALLVTSCVFAFDRYRVARLKELDTALTESQKLTLRLTEQGAELRKANRYLALEAAVTNIISDAATLTEAAPKILQVICEVADWEGGELWEVETQTRSMRCVAAWQAAGTSTLPAARSQSASLAPGSGIGRTSQLPRDSETKRVADHFDEVTPHFAGAGSGKAIGFPILLGQEVFGILKLFTRAVRHEDKELFEIMTPIGSHIGQLIDRKRAEEALKKSREERLAELQRVRRRIARDLHDDIGSSLTQITILSEVAHQHMVRGEKQEAEPLARIICVSNELVDAMSDIVWAINPQKDHLSDLLQRMRRFASDIFTARNIAFRFHAPNAKKDIEFGANLRREIFLVFKESVNNVVKHSGCAQADIEFQIDDGWLTLRVRDDGEGFDVATDGDSDAVRTPQGRGGNGINSMRKRAAEMGGEYKIVSVRGEGTSSTLRVPLSR